MKLKLSMAAAALAASACAAQASTYDATVEAANPLAYYNMANSTASTTTDAVNGYTMSLNNGAGVVAGSGPVINGSAVPSLVLANGASGAAYAGSGGSNPEMGGISSAGTVLAWINLAALPSADGRVFSIAGTSAVGDDVDLQINPDNTIHFYTDGGGSVASTPLTSGNVGQWMFVAGTFTANTDRELYLNGALVDSNTPGNHYDSDQPFYIGQSNVFGGRYFDGSIADVAFYNQDLSAAQIASIYASASASGVPTSATPEPSAWALMIAGVGAIGLALRQTGGRARRRLSGLAGAAA